MESAKPALTLSSAETRYSKFPRFEDQKLLLPMQLKPTDRVIDIGANRGVYAYPLAFYACLAFVGCIPTVYKQSIASKYGGFAQIAMHYIHRFI